VPTELIRVPVSTDFHDRVRALHRKLGIPADYARRRGMPLCEEPATLVATEPDYYDRPQRLTPEAFTAWTAMKRAAAADGVTLFLISAFRDLDYQHDLIARKLARGLSLQEILAINAAPGFSEHHTGRAVDLGTHGVPALSAEFENTEAFQWLEANAPTHRFVLSYPRGNPWGIGFEPWHWCYADSHE